MVTVTILHFNDVYNIEGGDTEPLGGASRMAAYIKSCQKMEPLVLFSGDALNPSLLSVFTKGDHMIPILNALPVHCAVYGNHDFDFGVDQLMDVAEKTTFPWLLSNVTCNLTNAPLADGRRKHMITCKGKKIGLIGLVEEEWLVTLATIDPEDVTYTDYVEEGVRLSRELRNEGADIVIALTHMRWPNDCRLAKLGEGIDLILGGHDHDYGVQQVNGTYVVKSGTDFLNMSCITLIFNKTNSVQIDVKRIDLDSSIQPDPAVLLIVESFSGTVETKMDEVLGTVDVDLDGRFSAVRTQETNLGNFITDVMLNSTCADLALLNSGTLRSNKYHQRGDFTMRDLFAILPLIDPIVVISITGEKLLSALENSVSQYPKLEGRFPQVAGIYFGFDPSKSPGNRIAASCVRIQGEPLIREKEYKLCTKEYLSLGKDGYKVFRDCDVLVNAEQGIAMSTAVQNHFHSIQVCKGLKPCRSGHKQSIINLNRRQNLVRQNSLDLDHHDYPLVRQHSIHEAELEVCEVSPRVEGRIYICTL